MTITSLNINTVFSDVLHQVTEFFAIGNRTISELETRLKDSLAKLTSILNSIDICTLNNNEINELMHVLKPYNSLLNFFANQLKKKKYNPQILGLIINSNKEIDHFILNLEIELSESKQDETLYLLSEPNGQILMNSVRNIENVKTIDFTFSELSNKIN